MEPVYHEGVWLKLFSNPLVEIIDVLLENLPTHLKVFIVALRSVHITHFGHFTVDYSVDMRVFIPIKGAKSTSTTKICKCKYTFKFMIYYNMQLFHR